MYILLLLLLVDALPDYPERISPDAPEVLSAGLFLGVALQALYGGGGSR